MIRNLRTWITALLLLLSLTTPDYARGPASSSSSSSSSSRSSSSSSSSSSYRPSSSSSGSSYKPSSSPSSSSSYNWGTSQKATPKSTSKADQATSAYTNQSTGTTSRSTWFNSEPQPDTSLRSSVKPAKVSSPPSSTVLANGQRAPITYDQSRGGYGYTNELGTWIMWSSFSQPHTTIVNNYGDGYSGSSSGYSSTPSKPVDWSGLWTFFLWLIIGVLIFGTIVFGINWYNNSQQRPAYDPETDYNHRMAPTTPKDDYEAIPLAQPVKTKFEKWCEVLTGSIITLKDAQALKDCQDHGIPISKGMQYTVLKTVTIETQKGLVKYRFFFLEYASQGIILLIKEAGGHCDHRVYFEAPGFVQGTRQDMLDSDQAYLFQQPEHSSSALPDLLYTTQVFREEEGNALTYALKQQGEQTGPAKEDPLGVPRCVGTIVEYISQDKTDNPELLVLETGANESTHIQLFLGAAIRPSEIEVLRKG